MLTGTPLDLTPFGDVLRWIGNAAISLWLLATVWWVVSRVGKRKTTREKWSSGAKVLCVMLGIPAALIGWRAFDVWKERTEFRARYEKADTLFKKRCETAGEFIYKTVPDVKGVAWMKWRDGSGKNDVDYQYGLYDPYGRDCGDESCIKQLLRSTFVVPNRDLNKLRLPENGYEFVEAADSRDSQRYRYVAGVFATGKRSPEDRAIATRNDRGVDPGEDIFDFAMQRRAIVNFSARYGITWDDVSTREDRENWIAGGTTSVIDLQTNEVIARRVGYMMDRGLGSTAGFRDPWSFAAHNSCPAAPADANTDSGLAPRHAEKTAFLFKVLQPTRGEAR
ncbi:hypothetical protein [Ideonella sp.]|uniref:hypothetical protein n=1 Tax=Ideonella sp. TaxID=1929293 RepID=UPI0035B0297C